LNSAMCSREHNNAPEFIRLSKALESNRHHAGPMPVWITAR
jgi:hypothetical protein